MLTIALGTTSGPKLLALQSILNEIDLEANVITVAAASEVSNQPRSKNETRLGSINRARNALDQVSTADIGIGIEVGYEPINGILSMHGFSSIIDREGNIFSEQSSTLELPKHFLQFLHDKDKGGVGDHVADYEKRNNSKAWKLFSGTIRHRMPFINESIRNVLLHYLFRDEY